MAARAQQPVMPVVGIMRSTEPDEAAAFLGAFSEGFRNEGYIDGQNVTVDLRMAGNVYDRLPAIAADLVRRRVAVIVATGAVNTPLAAKAATTTIPIVFIISSDPVERGLVRSLNRAEGNITGATLFGGPLNAKRVELLRELIPQSAAIGLLVNPNNSNSGPETNAVLWRKGHKLSNISRMPQNRQPGPPMTLGNMRANGVRRLAVSVPVVGSSGPMPGRIGRT
ncbi:MAG TPA: ABC transporter substrate binding protein [Steroidobacteraceae bacterium]